MVRIILNGAWLEVKELRFEEADIMADEYYHDCHITFMRGDVETYDACDVIVLKEGEYTDEDVFMQ